MLVPALVAAACTILISLAGGLLTEIGPWYKALRKPGFQPPDYLFGPAWTVILTLTAIAATLSWHAAHGQGEHARVLVLFGINYTLHFLWTPLFFKFRRPDWALAEVAFLWLSIAALILGLAPISPLASLLVVPYILWVSFAAAINLRVVQLNAPFGGRQTS